MASEDVCPDVAAKESWPELVKTNGNEAVKVIQKENTALVEVFTILEGTIITAEFRSDRVRVWVDTDGIVTRIPTIG